MLEEPLGKALVTVQRQSGGADDAPAALVHALQRLRVEWRPIGSGAGRPAN